MGDKILAGKKVVMIAHGEGAQYAHTIYRDLDQTRKQSVSLVYIAPFANSIADGQRNSYITRNDDVAVLKLINQSATISQI